MKLMFAALDPSIDTLRHALFQKFAVVVIVASIAIVVGGLALHLATRRLEDYLVRKLRRGRSIKR
jgi:signal transduction histidine kinase